MLVRPESPAGTDDAISEAEMPNTGRATAATRCFQLDEAQMAEVLHMLPKWMTRPDVEKSDWFNDILVLLWYGTTPDYGAAPGRPRAISFGGWGETGSDSTPWHPPTTSCPLFPSTGCA